MAIRELAAKGQSLTESIFIARGAHPDRPILDTGFGEVVIDLDEFTARVAGRQVDLLDAGITRSDRVLITPNRGVQFWIDVVSVWGLGAVAAGIDLRGPQRIVNAVLDILQPKAAIVGVDGEAVVGDRAAIVDGAEARRESAEKLVIEPIGAEEPASIVFTSGSTGTPKGVVLSHHSLRGNATGIMEHVPIKASDSLFIALPSASMSALSHFLVSMFSGATFKPCEDPLLKADLFNALEKSNATAFGGAPLQIRWLADAAKDRNLYVRWIMSTGDHLPVDTIRRTRETFPDASVITVYGMTELGGRFCVLPPDLIDTAAGSVGYPITGLNVSVVDEATLEPVVQTEIGEIIADGDLLFDGYLNAPEATASAMTSGGMRTGDLGYQDENGRLYLVGRRDDVFKSAGLKVSSISITQALLETGMFDDLAVIPLEHELAGHVPAVLFVPSGKQNFDRRQAMRHLRGKLAANHVPSRFFEVDEIRRTATGKISRPWLRHMRQKFEA